MAAEFQLICPLRGGFCCFRFPVLENPLLATGNETVRQELSLPDDWELATAAQNHPEGLDWVRDAFPPTPA